MAQSQKIDYDRLPSHMQRGMRRYIEDGIPPGGFAMAVLKNDLVGAFARADETNKEHMEQWTKWLFNDVPAAAWGSEEAVDQWQEQGGL